MDKDFCTVKKNHFRGPWFVKSVNCIQAMEQLQRSILSRLQSLPKSTVVPALYCLLGIRPLEQELDLRRLTLLANILYIDGKLEQDVAMRQISVKDPGSHSWFVSCNDRSQKYSLPNIYTVRQVFESEAEFKQQVTFGIDIVKDSWSSMAENRKSLSLLNMEACNVEEVHPC